MWFFIDQFRSSQGGASSDVLIAKFNGNGNCLWAKSAGPTSGSTYFNDLGYSINVDPSGNVYLAGGFNAFNMEFGPYTISHYGGEDIFLAKYDSSGNVLWAKSVGGTDDEYAYSVCTDASGDVYIAGTFASLSLPFGSNTLSQVGYSTDIFYAKYDSSGNSVWAKSASGGFYSDHAYSINTDISGNIYLTGDFQSTSISFGSKTFTNSDNSGNTYDMFLVRFPGLANGVGAPEHANDIMIYPNPSKGKFGIKSAELSVDYRVEIYNMMGEKVYMGYGPRTNKTIDISSQPNGVYFLYLKSEEGSTAKKIIVSH